MESTPIGRRSLACSCAAAGEKLTQGNLGRLRKRELEGASMRFGFMLGGLGESLGARLCSAFDALRD